MPYFNYVDMLLVIQCCLKPYLLIGVKYRPKSDRRGRLGISFCFEQSEEFEVIKVD